jgi:hypothetical protein
MKFLYEPYDASLGSIEVETLDEFAQKLVALFRDNQGKVTFIGIEPGRGWERTTRPMKVTAVEFIAIEAKVVNMYAGAYSDAVKLVQDILSILGMHSE